MEQDSAGRQPRLRRHIPVQARPGGQASGGQASSEPAPGGPDVLDTPVAPERADASGVAEPTDASVIADSGGEAGAEVGGEAGREGEAASGGEDGAAPERPRRYSVRAQILAALREALLSGELAPGAVHSAPALAERFGVSATPVREAMQLLVREGAVEVVPNRGFRVTERSARELAELAEIRTMLEVPTLLRLGRTLPAERWEALRPLAMATVTAAADGDRVGYAEADHAFHRALIDLAGNRQLARVADELHRRSLGPAEPGPAPRAGDLMADASEHTALLDALAAHDLPGAERIARAHLSSRT